MEGRRIITVDMYRKVRLAWLRHVLAEMPAHGKDADITDLPPFNFKPPNA